MFLEFVQSIAPTWMKGETPAKPHYGERFMGTFGILSDVLAQAAIQAVRAWWLKDEFSPVDALPYLGEDRQIDRYPGDSDDTYRNRLIGAWDAWAVAGNEEAIVSQLESYGLTNIEIHSARNGWDWDSAAPGDWSHGVGGAANWSRFWVVIKGHPWLASNALDAGTALGLTATLEEVAAVRAIVEKWRAAEAICPWVIVVLDVTAWNAGLPNGTWYDWRNRNKAARYLDGRGQRPVIVP